MIAEPLLPVADWLPWWGTVSLRVIALSAGAWLLAGLLRSGPARWRVALWSLLFLGVGCAPLLSLLPGWRLPALELGSSAGASDAASEEVVSALSLATPDAHPDEKASAANRLAPAGRDVPARPASVIQGEPPPEDPLPWDALLLTIWIGIASIQLLMLALGLWRAGRLARHGTVIEEPAWLELVAEVGRTLALARLPELRRSSAVPAPMTGGLASPYVLLPEDADSWSEERRRIVLLHELTHIRRRDWVALIGSRCLCAIYWFNPLLWAALRRARLEREKACDEAVVATGIRASLYARQLLTVALQSSRSRGLATLAMARRSELEERLMSLIRQTRPRHQGAAALWPLLALTTLIVSVGTARWTKSEPSSGSALVSTDDQAIHYEVDGDFAIRGGRLFLSPGTVCWIRSDGEERELRLERREDGRVVARYWEDGETARFSPAGRRWLRSILSRHTDGSEISLRGQGVTARSSRDPAGAAASTPRSGSGGRVRSGTSAAGGGETVAPRARARVGRSPSTVVEPGGGSGGRVHGRASAGGVETVVPRARARVGGSTGTIVERAAVASAGPRTAVTSGTPRPGRVSGRAQEPPRRTVRPSGLDTTVQPGPSGPSSIARPSPAPHPGPAGPSSSPPGRRARTAPAPEIPPAGPDTTVQPGPSGPSSIARPSPAPHPGPDGPSHPGPDGPSSSPPALRARTAPAPEVPPAGFPAARPGPSGPSSVRAAVEAAPLSPSRARAGSVTVNIDGVAEVDPGLPFGVEPKRGSTVEITIRSGRSDHVLRIAHTEDGERSTEYRVDGERQPLDQAARRLFEKPARELRLTGTLTGELKWEYLD